MKQLALRWPWLVSDLDGTLVDRELRLVPRSVQALREYRDRGGVVVLATGRNEPSAGRYHRELGLDTPMILYNGARIVSANGAVLRGLDLGDAWHRLRAGLLGDLPAGVGAVAFVGRDAHRVRDAPALADYARRDRLPLLDSPVPEGAAVTKLMLIAAAPDALSGLEADIGRFAPGLPLTRSESTYLEVLPTGATKGNALRWLAGEHGVPLDRIAAIGDNPNDVDMLAVVGLGAAVGDGHPAVRAAADLVTVGCAEGAVADLVRRLLAEEPP